jgi:hypothetical protein
VPPADRLTGPLGGFITFDEAQPASARVVMDLPLASPS